MSSSEYHRNEARRCRVFAKTATPGSSVAARWHALAGEYDILAERLDRSALHHGGKDARIAAQQQPIRQPQSNTNHER
jgi:hypothetical protein